MAGFKTHATCPYCKAPVRTITAIPVEAKTPLGKREGVTFSCPSCGTVLGAGLDSLALCESLLARLRKKS